MSHISLTYVCPTCTRACDGGRFLYTDNSVLYIRYLSILPTLVELRLKLGHTVIDVGRLELYTCAGVLILGQNHYAKF